VQLNVVIWYFFFYAVIGYLVEVAYCSILQHRLVNRGFLYGPWLPIYGIGALVIAACTRPFAEYALVVFLATMALTSLVEYITSVALERFFGLRLWDYSGYRFNFRGRVCLKNTVLFGLLGLSLVYAIHPAIQALLAMMDLRAQEVGAHVIVLLLGIDTTASSLGMVSFTTLLERYHRRKGEIEERLAALAASAQARLLIEHLKEERHELLESLVARSRSILSRFPSLTSQSEERRGHLRTLRERLGHILEEHGNDEK
jgi:uncharacterized membrane protein